MLELSGSTQANCLSTMLEHYNEFEAEAELRRSVLSNAVAMHSCLACSHCQL